MLFKTRFHQGIQSGGTTLTFRAWDRARVKVGSTPLCVPIGRIQVEAVDEVALGSITAKQARASGFDSTGELVDLLKASSRRRLLPSSKVWRIRFQFLGPDAPAQPADTSADACDAVLTKLNRMDERSKHGAWTLAVLSAIAESPGLSSAVLAPRFDRERKAFKADVRKLKGLGLTESLEVGYRASKLGRAVLRRAKKTRV